MLNDTVLNLTEKLGLTGPPQHIGPTTVTDSDHGLSGNLDSIRRNFGTFFDAAGLGFDPQS